MSYILESLKKSDAQRQGQQAAAALIQRPAFLQQSQKTHSRMRGLGVLIVLALLLLALAWLAYGRWAQTPPAVDAQTAPRPQPAAADAQARAASHARKLDAAVSLLYEAAAASALSSAAPVAASTETTLEIIPKTIPETTSETGPELSPAAAPANTAATVPLNAPDSVPGQQAVIPLVYDLDSLSKRKIPAIDYGAHIFATDQASGFVILNGAKKKAGERLRSGIYIEKIAEDRVVLSYQGLLFSLPAMKSWSYK